MIESSLTAHVCLFVLCVIFSDEGSRHSVRIWADEYSYVTEHEHYSPKVNV